MGDPPDPAEPIFEFPPTSAHSPVMCSAAGSRDPAAELLACTDPMNEVVLKVSAWAAIIALPTVMPASTG